jgi:hypothetical protein
VAEVRRQPLLLFAHCGSADASRAGWRLAVAVPDWLNTRRLAAI